MQVLHCHRSVNAAASTFDRRQKLLFRPAVSEDGTNTLLRCRNTTFDEEYTAIDAMRDRTARSVAALSA